MKLPLIRYVLCFWSIFTIFNTTAQDTLKFENLKIFADYTTGVFKEKYSGLSFLKHRLITPQFNIFDNYSGQETDSICNLVKYLSLINDLDISNYENDKVINLDYAQNVMIKYHEDNITALSIALVEYNMFNDSAIYFNYIDFSNNKFIDNSPKGFYPFKKNILFASTVLNQVFNRLSIDVIFNDSLFLSNLDVRIIDSVMIDFDDGIGFRSLLKNIPLRITYSTYGTKFIRIKLKLDKRDLISSSTIEITNESNDITRGRSCATPIQPPDVGPLTISTGILGTLVTGKYAIWYSTCNTNQKLRKPFIVSAGYNPGNGKQLLSGLVVQNNLTLQFLGQPILIPNIQWNGEWRGTFYETYNGCYSKRFSEDEYNFCGEHASNGSQLFDRLREEGYDIIILMYDDGEDITYNNAALFIELIQRINTEKFSNGYYFENIVCGFSAGGLTTRLALAIMESRYKQNIGPHPHTKIWINFEGENGGANIPLGFQHLLSFQSSSANLMPSAYPLQSQADQINQIVAILANKTVTSDNARELISYNASTPGNTHHALRTNLLNTFANIPLNNSSGYPEYCRRIGISQGSGIGSNVQYTRPEIFDSKLKVDLGTTTVTSIPNSSSCSRQYTWKMPNAQKRTTARWWSTNNNNYIFEGNVYLDLGFTYSPMYCARIPLLGCQCSGPYEVNSFIQLGQKSIPKPINLTLNYDDAPASTLSSHIELYEYSTYPFYNNTLAGSAFANKDPSLHSFTTTVSVLDLHDPNNNYTNSNNFLSPDAIGLMQINYSSKEPSRRFGFPHILHPFDHYQITPFDAVYAIGLNNGTFVGGAAKPNNQMHVEDPQSFIGDYLSQVEVAPENLFLSNRNLSTNQNNYIAEFEARSKIIIGNSIYSNFGNPYNLTPDGDFIVSQNSHAILHSGDAILFLPGTLIDFGAQLDAYIQGYPCNNILR